MAHRISIDNNHGSLHYYYKFMFIKIKISQKEKENIVSSEAPLGRAVGPSDETGNIFFHFLFGNAGNTKIFNLQLLLIMYK